MSFNEGMCWNIFLINKFKGKLNWMGVSSKFNFNNNIDLIDKYKEEIVRKDLSINEEVKYTEEILREFASKWIWYPISEPLYFGEGLSSNYAIFSSLFKDLSINDIELFLKYYLLDINKSNNDESYELLNRKQIDKMSSYDSYQEEDYDPLKDNPNYDSESDLDQQGPYFVF